MDYRYSGFYGRFEAPTKKLAGVLTGADTLVGDDFAIEFKTDEGRTLAVAKNKFDVEVGVFDADASRKLQLASAEGMTIRALLSFIAYSESPEPGVYWGKMALICYRPADESIFGPFVENVSAKLCDGVRTDVHLGSLDIQMLEKDPSWMPHGTIFLPETSKGSAIIKSKRLMSEKVVEQGRRRAAGCYVGTVVFFVVIVAVIVFALRSCGVF